MIDYAIYFIVLKYVNDKTVLDYTVNNGLGSYVLACSAKHVSHIDYLNSSVIFEYDNYAKENLTNINVTNTELPFKCDSFEIIINDCIHDQLDKNQNKILYEIFRVINKSGILIIVNKRKFKYIDLKKHNNISLNQFKQIIYNNNYVHIDEDEYKQAKALQNNILIITNNNKYLKNESNRLDELLKESENDKIIAEEECKNLRKMVTELIEKNNNLIENNNNLMFQYYTISNAMFWKMTKPLRSVSDKIKAIYFQISLNCIRTQFIKVIKYLFSRNSNNNNFKQHKSYGKSNMNISNIALEELNSKRLKYYSKIKNVSINIIENKKEYPLVSVVAPAYNHSKFIGDCLNSIANQTYQNIELIIIDDYSTDNTPETINAIIVEKYFQNRFVEIKFIKHMYNKGAQHTINEGLNIANGKFISIINTDDMYENNRIEEMIKSLLYVNNELAFSKIMVIDESGNIAKQNQNEKNNYGPNYFIKVQNVINQYKYIHLALLRTNVAISTGNLLFKKSLINKIGGFGDYNHMHDWDFVLRAMICSEPLFVQTTNYLYRLHNANTYKTLLEDIDSNNIEGFTIMKNIAKKLLAGNYENKSIEYSSITEWYKNMEYLGAR